jgi:hypothetical protein
LAAQPVAEVLQDAEQALSAGDPARTVELTQILLMQNTDDFAALYLLSLAHSDLGKDEAAAQVAARAYGAALDDVGRLQAARLVGGARFRLSHYTRAQWWLRIAANYATTPEEAATVAREFQQIQRTNPLSAQANLSIAPTDNINNGADSDLLSLEGIDIEFRLPAETQALSGIEYAGDLQLSYRISQDARQITTVDAHVYARSFVLSAATQGSVPGLKGSDYALALAEVALTQRRFLIDGLGPTTVSGGVGHVQFSGQPLWDYTRLTLGQEFAVGPDSVLRVQASMQNQMVRNDIVSDTKVYNLTTSYATQRPNSDRLQLSLVGILNDAEIDENTFSDISGSINYSFARPILNIDWSVAAGIGHTNYDEFALSLDGRRDDYITVGGTGVLTDLSYFGFSPSLTVTATKRQSNVDPYNSTQIQARIGIQSNF